MVVLNTELGRDVNKLVLVGFSIFLGGICDR